MRCRDLTNRGRRTAPAPAKRLAAGFREGSLVVVDADGAHPFHSHVIVSGHQGQSVEVSSWQYEDGAFKAEPLEEV